MNGTERATVEREGWAVLGGLVPRVVGAVAAGWWERATISHSVSSGHLVAR